MFSSPCIRMRGPVCEQGHEAGAQVQHAQASIQWAAEYLIKCHISKEAFVGQVSPVGDMISAGV